MLNLLVTVHPAEVYRAVINQPDVFETDQLAAMRYSIEIELKRRAESAEADRQDDISKGVARKR